MGGYAYADDNPATHADPTGLLLPSEGGGCPSTDPGCPGNTSTDPTTPASPPGPPAAASPPGTPASPGGCGFLGLTCTAHFLTDAWHGVTSTATGLATSILQPLRDAQSCLTGSTTGCQNTALFLLASPLYALKNTITATITTGHAIYHEFTTGHPGQAIGTIATLILIAALAKKLAPTAETAPETFFRTMSKSNFNQLQATGRVPATSETFISPSQEYAQGYDGVTARFSVRAGTQDALAGVGVRDASAAASAAYPDMPLVSSGWTSTSAFLQRRGRHPEHRSRSRPWDRHLQ
jgi:hypothetical protein